MTSVDCYRADCRWCVCGACTRGSITIDEMGECEGFESYRDSYTESYWIACSKTKKHIYKRLITRGAKIEYNGYVFYTKDMITETENYGLTLAMWKIPTNGATPLQDIGKHKPRQVIRVP